MSPSMFILETAIHIEHIDGYTVLAHNPNVRAMSKRIEETISSKNNTVEVFFSPIERSHTEESKFEEQCTMYFERNFETLAENDTLILPWRLSENHMGIEGIMDRWCRDTNTLSRIKGLVVHKFFLAKCLKLYGFTKENLRDSLHIKKFSEAPITLVYNPHEKVILLIRKSESEKLATDMLLSLYDLNMFILLFNVELKESGVKLIPLVLTAGKPKSYHSQLNCQQCQSHVFSEDEFETFISCWKDKESYFQPKSAGKLRKGFSKEFLVKVTSLMAATYVYHDCLPKFASKTREGIENLAVLLTREQMEIFYSQDKHVIIKGGFGCGKTIVAAAILEKISESMLEHEKLFYICFDSKSALINHMAIDKQESDVTKVRPVHNINGHNLSQIISDILQKQKVTEKINFVIDEYDSEYLDELEANKLNNIFTNNQLVKEAFIFLIVQPIEKERTLNNIQRKTNMFHLLKTMKTHQLTLVMRNSTEIHELVAATKKILSEEKTVYIHQNNNRASSERENSQVRSIGNTAWGSEKVSNDSLNELKPTQKDRQVYPDQTPKIEIDEAHAIAGSFAETGNGENKTISKFRYATAGETGHKISSKKPILFDLEDGNKFQNILSLIAIFEKLDIRNKRQVLLHFDTVNDEIPNTLQFIFEHHFGIHGKITNNYQEFASLKSILVCSYRTFRGLEHPKITVVIDRDIYFLQHYLVESLSRCTSRLTIIILQNSTILTKVTEEWKKNQLVNQWKTICNKDTHKKDFVIKKQKDDKIINATFKEEYYEKLEERFNGLSTNKDDLKKSKMESFARNVIERTR